nr:hypothetical protein CKG001_09270 [Bdellovibrio sp. CKG001]BFD62245.1 hypothetical protein BdHM001_09260 [Bdellovibrio sp. HM001]
MKKILWAILFVAAAVPEYALAKDVVSTGTFNQMIDEGNAAAKDLNATIARNVSSTGGATFKGDVITVVDSKRNPVKYNPFLIEDEVEVKSIRDSE